MQRGRTWWSLNAGGLNIFIKLICLNYFFWNISFVSNPSQIFSTVIQTPVATVFSQVSHCHLSGMSVFTSCILNSEVNHISLSVVFSSFSSLFRFNLRHYQIQTVYLIPNQRGEYFGSLVQSAVSFTPSFTLTTSWTPSSCIKAEIKAL